MEFQSFIILCGDVFWSAELFSGAEGSQHLSRWQALLPRSKEGSKLSTEHATVQFLASQVFFFSSWEAVWGTLPSFPFYLGTRESFCSKAWKEKGTSAHSWNTLALAFGGRQQSPRKNSHKDALEVNTLARILGFPCSGEDLSATASHLALIKTHTLLKNIWETVPT